MNKQVVFKYAFLWLILFSTGNLFSQHVYYSQYQLTPLLNNPALISMSDYLKVDLGYRNQFGGSLSNFGTPLFSASMPIMKDITPDESKRIGVGGIQILNDRMGKNGLVSTNGVSIAYAQNIQLAKGQYLALGIQPGIYQRRLDYGKLTSGNQYDAYNGIYNSSLPLLENVTGNERRTFATVNAGVVFYQEDGNGGQKYYISAGANNISRPNISLNDKTFQNPINWNLIASFRAWEDYQFELQPTVRMIQLRNVNQTNIGSYLYYKINNPANKGFVNDGKLGLGLWYSVNNAVIAALEYQQPDYTIGISYDFIASKLSQAPGRNGAPEIMVGFRKFFGKKKNISGAAGEARKPETKAPETKPIETPKPSNNDRPSNNNNEVKPSRPNNDGPITQPTRSNENVKTVQDPKTKPVQGKAKMGQAYKPGEKNKKVNKAQKGGSGFKSKNLPQTKNPKAIGQNSWKEDPNELLLDEDKLGVDPYEGTENQLTAKEKRLLRKMPKYSLNDYELTDENLATLNQIAKVMKKKPLLKLEIGGFGCNTGDPEATKKIAYGRAETARRYLERQGIDPDRLGIKVGGSQDPVADNETEEGRAKNRRIQFRLMR